MTYWDTQARTVAHAVGRHARGVLHPRRSGPRAHATTAQFHRLVPIAMPFALNLVLFAVTPRSVAGTLMNTTQDGVTTRLLPARGSSPALGIARGQVKEGLLSANDLHPRRIRRSLDVGGVFTDHGRTWPSRGSSQCSRARNEGNRFELPLLLPITARSLYQPQVLDISLTSSLEPPMRVGTKRQERQASEELGGCAS
jgi:hypothetical protein